MNLVPPQLSASSRRVALYTEGTYPQAHGGVSVWVDQLVRGLPEHMFSVQAISGVPFARPALELPSNVRFTQVPLWGPASTVRIDRAREGAILSAYGDVLEALCTLDVTAFGVALRALSEQGAKGPLTGVLEGARAARLTLEMWTEQASTQDEDRLPGRPRLPRPTVSDALDVRLRPKLTQPSGTPRPVLSG
ncbi:MAG: lipopolysaccharide glycosyltransferase [Deinococcus sp.]|nr:lipopolysaccharide glycosyltransferase [Deinococcus sp.]